MSGTVEAIIAALQNRDTAWQTVAERFLAVPETLETLAELMRADIYAALEQRFPPHNPSPAEAMAQPDVDRGYARLREEEHEGADLVIKHVQRIAIACLFATPGDGPHILATLMSCRRLVRVHLCCCLGVIRKFVQQLEGAQDLDAQRAVHQALVRALDGCLRASEPESLAWGLLLLRDMSRGGSLGMLTRNGQLWVTTYGLLHLPAKFTRCEFLDGVRSMRSAWRALEMFRLAHSSAECDATLRTACALAVRALVDLVHLSMGENLSALDEADVLLTFTTGLLDCALVSTAADGVPRLRENVSPHIWTAIATLAVTRRRQHVLVHALLRAAATDLEAADAASQDLRFVIFYQCLALFREGPRLSADMQESIMSALTVLIRHFLVLSPDERAAVMSGEHDALLVLQDRTILYDFEEDATLALRGHHGIWLHKRLEVCLGHIHGRMLPALLSWLEVPILGHAVRSERWDCAALSLLLLTNTLISGTGTRQQASTPKDVAELAARVREQALPWRADATCPVWLRAAAVYACGRLGSWLGMSYDQAFIDLLQDASLVVRVSAAVALDIGYGDHEDSRSSGAGGGSGDDDDDDDQHSASSADALACLPADELDRLVRAYFAVVREVPHLEAADMCVRLLLSSSRFAREYGPLTCLLLVQSVEKQLALASAPNASTAAHEGDRHARANGPEGVFESSQSLADVLLQLSMDEVLDPASEEGMLDAVLGLCRHLGEAASVVPANADDADDFLLNETAYECMMLLLRRLLDFSDRSSMYSSTICSPLASALATSVPEGVWALLATALTFDTPDSDTRALMLIRLPYSAPLNALRLIRNYGAVRLFSEMEPVLANQLLTECLIAVGLCRAAGLEAPVDGLVESVVLVVAAMQPDWATATATMPHARACLIAPLVFALLFAGGEFAQLHWVAENANVINPQCFDAEQYLPEPSRRILARAFDSLALAGCMAMFGGAIDLPALINDHGEAWRAGFGAVLGALLQALARRLSSRKRTIRRSQLHATRQDPFEDFAQPCDDSGFEMESWGGSQADEDGGDGETLLEDFAFDEPGDEAMLWCTAPGSDEPGKSLAERLPVGTLLQRLFGEDTCSAELREFNMGLLDMDGRLLLAGLLDDLAARQTGDSLVKRCVAVLASMPEPVPNIDALPVHLARQIDLARRVLLCTRS